MIDENKLKEQMFALVEQIGDERLHIDAVVQLIDDAQTVDAVEVATGTWKAVTDDGENYKRICTCCGKEAPFDELEGVYLIYPHCPWCGADMWKDGDGK